MKIGLKGNARVIQSSINSSGRAGEAHQRGFNDIHVARYYEMKTNVIASNTVHLFASQVNYTHHHPPPCHGCATKKEHPGLRQWL